MVLKVTKETFQEAVQENVDVFGMSMDEAIEETAKQFQAQGIDANELNEIMKRLVIKDPEDCTRIDEAVSKLNEYLDSKQPNAIDHCDYVKYVQMIKEECDKGLNYRVYAGKKRSYDLVLNVMNLFDDETICVKEGLKALTSLMTQQPDLLDVRGVKLINDYLDRKKSDEIRRLLFKWVKECCVLHEVNRQKIFDSGILDHIKPVLTDKVKSPMLRDVLAVLRALVLDDDVRVEFGKAHEHARVIASDTLCHISKLLDHFKMDELFTYDLMLTLNALLVRTEFCKKLEDAGGLVVVQEAMVNFQKNEKLMRQCFKLLKSLSGNDDCKRNAIQNGCGPIVVEALNRHKDKAPVAISGLGCIAALTLRSPDNSKIFYESGGPECIVDCLRIHVNDQDVQKNASWAIRNMVSRSRYQCAKFIELGAETLLKEGMKKFKLYEYDIKAALRDLGCDVHLKEEWTGKGGLLNTAANATKGTV